MYNAECQYLQGMRISESVSDGHDEWAFSLEIDG